MTIDLNCDLGEGGPHDAMLMPLVSSANIACGGHAGDEGTMAAAVDLARRHGVAIGAHPGYRDAAHFGRRDVPLTAAATADLVLHQVAALARIAGTLLHHVKLHGALYNRVSHDTESAAAVVAALASHWPGLVVYALADSPFVALARSAGLAVAAEAFLDRGYAADGALLPRSSPGAVICDPRAAAVRARRFVQVGLVTSVAETDLGIRPDTLCIHGDGADPVSLARAVRDALDQAGVAVRPPAGRRARTESG
ncbi:MAG: LamB/YcsF family protein [Planctomycetia bacterium]|nr:LamB/YcsF family protein [Planctomycetia bacterium]